MTFTSQTFREANTKHNYIVKSRLQYFHSKVDCSGLSIKLPLSGTEVYHIDGKEHTIDPGGFLLVNKGQSIRCDISSQKLVDSICLYLDKELYSSIIDSFQKGNVFNDSHNSPSLVVPDKYYIEEGGGLSNILTSISRCKSLATFTEEDFILITEELAKHQLQQKSFLQHISAQNYSTKEEILRRLKIAKSYIFDNYDQAIQLEDIAHTACFSKYHLLRSFREVFGITPYQLLLARRIFFAKRKLENNYPIEEIAAQCGFNNRRAFTRVFKKIEGITPSHYQQTHSSYLSKSNL